MKIKVTIWADVDETEYDSITDAQDKINLIIRDMIDYDVDSNITRKQWERDGLDWTEDE